MKYEIEIPDEYLKKFVPTGEYRVPKVDEWYLCNGEALRAPHTLSMTNKLIILRLRTITRKRFVETGEVRKAFPNDYVETSYGVIKAGGSHVTTDEYPIYRLETFEEEVS